MGKAGAGKDSAMQSLLKYHPNTFHEIISCTSRPMRDYEKDGINYHFLTKEEFFEQINKNRMLEYTCFNNWYYGTCFDNLVEDKINIGVYNPSGVRLLISNPNVEILPIYIDASKKIRLLRQLNREDKPDVDEIIRRYSADELDFADLNDINFQSVLNENIDLIECARRIRCIIGSWTEDIN